jgi:hypothetical protein
VADKMPVGAKATRFDVFYFLTEIAALIVEASRTALRASGKFDVRRNAASNRHPLRLSGSGTSGGKIS